jgi:trans-AT polyketide synthase/acyltransferase/oxidoreductase domain-containing protein
LFSNRIAKSFIKGTKVYIMKAYVFPGQGSQKKGMGEVLFQRFPDYVESANQTLGYSVEEVCLRNPDSKLEQTIYTQPCLFVVSALSFLAYQETNRSDPAYFAGHSLGEFNALLAAGAFDFTTGLKLVKKRAELMSQATGGGMTAVINFSEKTLLEIILQQGNTLDIANLNSPKQIVISGLKKEIEKAVPVIQKAGGICIPLRVGSAFHSRHMLSAKHAFDAFIQDFSFTPISIPVISNVTAQPHELNSLATNLAKQIVSSVRWTETIAYLFQKGCTEFKEIGPGNVLTKLIGSIRQTRSPMHIEASHQNIINKTQSKAVTTDAPKIEQDQRNIVFTKITHSPTRPHRPEKATNNITGSSLGSSSFRKTYGLRYAYVAGSMYKGIASKELVVRMGKAGLLAFLGTGGLQLSIIEEAIRFIQSELNSQEAYGMNLIYNLVKPSLERETVDLFLRYGVSNIEASAYMQLTPALVYFRVQGLYRTDSGIRSKHRIMAKVSRPEVAKLFLSPPPERILRELETCGDLTPEQVRLAATVPMADDICVEADSAGHTDMGVASVLIPTIVRQRDDLKREFGYENHIHIGAAGGIGTPESAAAAFILGAEFILTGSINQCTVEAGTSDTVKDMLQSCNVQDTTYAPAGDMFELGAKVQVLKRGVFFPARANKLYDLWQRYASLDEIDPKTRTQIEEKFFGRTFDEVYQETKTYYLKEDSSTIEKAERNPKHKMALIFRYYFIHSMRLAFNGTIAKRIDFQVHCGPSMGAFNQWVKGTPIETWRKRHVDQIGVKIMDETAALINDRIRSLLAT